jgi:hypothetical protein
MKMLLLSFYFFFGLLKSKTLLLGFSVLVTWGSKSMVCVNIGGYSSVSILSSFFMVISRQNLLPFLLTF